MKHVKFVPLDISLSIEQIYTETFSKWTTFVKGKKKKNTLLNYGKHF